MSEPRSGTGRQPQTSSTVAPQNFLDAALSTFDEFGYSATPVPAIAGRAGVAVGSVYRYFPGKEDLANALLGRPLRGLEEMTVAMADSLIAYGLVKAPR